MSAIDPREVLAYYHYATEAYLRDCQTGWHIGIWDPGVATQREANRQSNRRLVDGLAITRESCILDAGCGVGGFAVWAAEQFGCRVTGISLSPVHTMMARSLASRAGVGDRCHFAVMDMTEMDFPDRSFDLVINQETVCYVQDKERYLRDVVRVLREGGSWRAVDYFLGEAPLEGKQRAAHRAFCEGFLVAPGGTPAELVETLARAGFVDVRTEDLSERTKKTLAQGLTRAAVRRSRDYVAGLADGDARRYLRGHFRAYRAFGRGIAEGYFKYGMVAASRDFVPEPS